jgi:hypothetical protein
MRIARLMQLIDTTLHEVAAATEDWQLHFTLHRARKLIRAERAARAGAAPGQPGMMERVIGFDRVRTGWLLRLQTHPEEAAQLRQRVAEYDADLLALHLEDHELDRSPRWGSPWLVALLLAQAVSVFFLLPPIVMVGYVVNGPAVGLLELLARYMAPRVKDKASIKLVGGVVLFPLAWIAAGLLAVHVHGSAAALMRLPEQPVLVFMLTVALSVLGGVVALRYLRWARETARAVRVRITRRVRQAAVERLRAERAALCDQMLALAEGLQLPGTVQPDGRVLAVPTTPAP